LDDVLDPIDKIPKISDIQRLPYTEKVLRESMRLYPPVWLIGRTVNSEYAVSKYAIPAGSSLLMSQYVMHHDSRYYNQPEVFQPDRWTQEFKNSLPRFAYFPFGGGIRGCIGETFAWTEGILAIASISRQWKMRMVDNQQIELDAGITLRPKRKMKMKLFSR
jgi:cytochrome P450